MSTEKYIDLHTHSIFSDGTFSPHQIVENAKEKGLAAIALTDHDCVAGVDKAIEAGKLFNIEVISGIELATYYPNKNGVEIHIVGLFLDHKNKELIKKTEEIMENRNKRNIEMTKKITSLGFPITYEELVTEAGHNSCSRTHYANLMLKKGYIKTKNEAFQRYISHGMPGFVQRELPTPKDCLDIIKNSGGVAVLAHPTLYNMNYNQIKNMALDLKTMGLDGIETMYSTYKPEQQREITKIAMAIGLKPSGGSDFHGLNKPDISIGTGMGSLRVPESFLAELKESL